MARTNGVLAYPSNFFGANIKQGSFILFTNMGTNGFWIALDTSITNGLATTNYVNVITNGLATTNYVNTVTNGLVMQSVTNGLATTNYVNDSGVVVSNGAIIYAMSVTNVGFLRTNSNPIAILGNSTNNVPDTKTMALVKTNEAGGSMWLSVMPVLSRRRLSYALPNGGGVSSIGENAASTGSAGNVNATSNNWAEITHTTSASANADAGISGAGNVNTRPGLGNIYGAFVGRISQTSTQRTQIGFTSTTLALQNASDALTTASTALIRYSTTAGDTNWSFVTCDGTACTTTVGNLTTVNTNRHVWEIREERDNLRWIAYIDGVPLATNTANLPIAPMQYMFGTRTLENVAKVQRLEIYYCEQDGSPVSY